MKNKLYLSLLSISIVFLSCNQAAKKEMQTAGCPPENVVSGGTFDTDKWTYTHDAAGIEFRLPVGWYFLTDVGGQLDPDRKIAVNSPFPLEFAKPKDKTLREIGEMSVNGSFAAYFVLENGLERTQSVFIDMGVYASPNGDVEADMAAIKKGYDAHTEQINREINQIRQENSSDSIPDFVYEVQLKKGFPVGTEEWTYMEIRANVDDTGEYYIQHAMKNFGCYNFVIRIQYNDEGEKEEIYNILKNNIRNMNQADI